MSKSRIFKGKPARRLIISVEMKTVNAIDQHIHTGNRSEFIRQAIEEKLQSLKAGHNQPRQV